MERMEIIPEQKPIDALRKRDMAILIAVALLFDLASLVPGDNVLAAILGQSIIPLLFSRYGINVFSFKKVVPYIVASIIEVIPGASALPAFTLETMLIIWLSRRTNRRQP